MERACVVERGVHYGCAMLLVTETNLSKWAPRLLMGLAVTVAGLGQVTAATTITNVAGLRQAALAETEVVCDVRIEATVCAASATGREMVLQDDSGAELLLLGTGSSVSPGRRILLTGAGCQLILRDWGISITRPPIIVNDGLHATAERSGAVSLATGRIPIRLEWFNGGEERDLRLSYEGPRLDRTRVSDAVLFRSDLDAGTSQAATNAGLNYRCFQGRWLSLPNFQTMLPVAEGVTNNFNLEACTRRDNVGLEFAGYLAIAHAGDYTFHLASDDGSRLYVGELLPSLQLNAMQAPPVPRILDLGAVLKPEEESRWVEVEGVVRHVLERPECAEIELESGQYRLRVGVVERSGLQPAFLLNSRVRIAGVGRSALRLDGAPAFGLLAVASLWDVRIQQLAVELRETLPVAKIGELIRQSSPDAGRMLRLSGRVSVGDQPGSLVVSDDTGVMPLEKMHDEKAISGRDAEVFGSVHRHGTNLYFRCAFIGEVDGAIVRKAETPAILTSAEQVQRLTRSEAGRGWPARIRGVITCDAPELNYANVIQDETRGLFFYWGTAVTGSTASKRPRLGEYWEIRGRAEPGQFAPVVRAQEMIRLGQGQLPAPLHPTWDQLMSGALDTQYVELTGIITSVQSNVVSLLTHGGKIRVEFGDLTEPELRRYENSLVRMRGCLLAKWESLTHQVRLGEVRLASATIIPISSGMLDPFLAPLKSVQDLLLYDLQAGAFQRVKMTGQIVFERNGEHFMMAGTNGVRFIARELVGHISAALVEVVGIPELGGPSPILREAIVRRLGVAPLPEPTLLPADELLTAGHDATRVRIQAVLVGVRQAGGDEILDLQLGGRSFSARLAGGRQPPLFLAPGSQLELTGVYAALIGGHGTGQNPGAFELLLDSTTAVRVIARPPWWTPGRMLAVLGGLVAVLILAALWITQLRQRVEERTKQLEREIHEREQAEQQRAMAEERSRIARDLHDDLGSSLTEISVLASTGLRPTDGALRSPALFNSIANKSHRLVTALDAIVWAIDPKENTLQSLADYLAGYVGDYIAATDVKCRFKIPVEFPRVTLDGKLRHELFLVVKEALHNVVRHAQASEVEFQVAAIGGNLEVVVTDNGRGFDPSATHAGHGLKNFTDRMARLGGQCVVSSHPGEGSTVRFRLPLPASKEAAPGAMV